MQTLSLVNIMSDFSLNIQIVEDDLALAIDLEMIVEEMGYNVIARVDNSAEALETVYTKSPDLILMDIDIKGNMSGIEIAEKIRHLDIPVLFITSHNDQEHFGAASQTNYIGYLVKPVNKFTLRSTIETTFKLLSKNEQEINGKPEAELEQEAFPYKDHLFLKKRGVLHKIKIPNILYVSANDDYTITMTEDGKFISSLRLFEIQKLLEPFDFIKVHRSHLVNLNKVHSIDTNRNILKIGEHEVPVSRSNKQTIIEKIQLIK